MLKEFQQVWFIYFCDQVTEKTYVKNNSFKKQYFLFFIIECCSTCCQSLGEKKKRKKTKGKIMKKL